MADQIDRGELSFDSVVSAFWETPQGYSLKLMGDLAAGAYEWISPAIEGSNAKTILELIPEFIVQTSVNAARTAGNMLYKLAIQNELPESVAGSLSSAANLIGEVWEGGAKPFLSGTLNTVLGLVMSGPAMKLFDNAQNAQYRPEMLSPQELWQYAMRGQGFKPWDKYAKFSGYSDDQLDVIAENFYNTASIELIQLGKAYYGWDKPKVDKLLRHMGYPIEYDSDEANAISSVARLATEQPMALNDAFELERRGKLDEGVLDKNLSLLGFEEHYREWLKNLTERTPDPDMVRELIRRGKLDQERGNELVGWLGWPDDIKDKWPDLVRTVLSPFEYREHYLRGYLTEAQFREGLTANGIQDIDQDNFVKASFTPPTPSDLVRMGVREVFTPDVVKEFELFSEFPEQIVPWGRQVGLSREVLKFHWAAHWDLPSPTQGYDMFHRGLIDKEQLELLLRTKDYMPYWRDKLIGISYNLIPWRLILKLAQSKVFDINKSEGHFQKLGYTKEDSQALSKYIKSEWQIQYEWPTISQVIELYAIGEVPKNDVDTIIDLLGYQGAKKKYYERIAEEKKKAHNASSGRLDSASDISSAKTSAKTKVLEGVRKGIIPKDEGKEMLLELGYSEEASDFYLLSAELDRDIEIQEKIYKLTEDQYLSGVINRAKAVAELDLAGYSVHNAGEIVDLWEKEKVSRERIQKENPRLPTKADLSDWLNDGIITADTWIEYMEKLGYSEEISTYYLMELLLDMEGKG